MQVRHISSGECEWVNDGREIINGDCSHLRIFWQGKVFDLKQSFDDSRWRIEHACRIVASKLTSLHTAVQAVELLV